LRILPALQLALYGPEPSYPFLDLLLGVAVSLVDLLGRFPEVVELAQLVRGLRKHPPHGPSDRMLSIGDDAYHRNLQPFGDLP
jgi:hypothetical protein